MTTSPRPYSRRHRRDRAARQFAQTLLGALGLLCAGGLWWLLSPAEPARSTGRPAADPAFAVRVRHSTAPAPSPSLAPASPIEPVALEPAPVEAPPAPIIEAAPAPAGAMFNGRPIRPVRTVRMLVTAYSPDARSCAPFADGITASGYSVWTNGMKLVAADARVFKFGDIISVPGYHEGQPVPVLDRGGKIKGHRLDVLYPTHETALKWGSQHLDVTVWEYAD